MLNSALIARNFSGFGNPLDLPIDLFLLLLDRIVYIQRLESNEPMSDREYVEFHAENQDLEE
jgi:hypothetical protein